MLSRFPKDVWKRTRDAILSSNGLELLRSLGALGVTGVSSGEPEHVARLAVELGWCRNLNGKLRLTDFGWMVSDSAREYINWIEDGRSFNLPVPLELSGKRILEVGCGWGRYVLTLRSLSAECVGIDPNAFYIQLGKIISERERVGDLPIACGAAESLPFGNEVFDFALCIRSFAYMNQPKALKELRRVLQPGGKLIIATPTIEMWRKRWRSRRLTLGSLGALAHHLHWLLNSYSVHFLGKRPFFFPASLKNPAYPTLAYLKAIKTKFGFRLIEPFPAYQTDTGWFVLERS